MTIWSWTNQILFTILVDVREEQHNNNTNQGNFRTQKFETQNPELFDISGFKLLGLGLLVFNRFEIRLYGIYLFGIRTIDTSQPHLNEVSHEFGIII